jgi:prolyl oligopeptidase
MTSFRLMLFAALTSASSALASGPVVPVPAGQGDDPYLWLEDVTGAKSLDWVRAHNAISQKELESAPGFTALRDRLLAILDSKARIPSVAKRGEYFYNFWQDAQHVRGLWRRTSLAEFRQTEPAWETVLDLDALSAAEKENWVWKGSSFLYPTYDRCLLQLSRGGGDAVVVREFDVTTKAFVPDGFILPEAKSQARWRNRDSLYVGTDFGPGSMTDSGYARIVKQWQRGTPLSAAVTVDEVKKADLAVGAYVSNEPGYRREFVQRQLTFFTREIFLIDPRGVGHPGAAPAGELRKLEVPADANAGTYRDQIMITLKSDWTVGGHLYPSGALLAMNLDRFLTGERDFQVLFTPTATTSLESIETTKNYLLLTELDNVRTRIEALQLKDGQWVRSTVPLPGIGIAAVSAVDEFESDDYFLTFTDFLTPSALYYGSVRPGVTVADLALLKQLPAFFDATGLEVTQFHAVSKDGTSVPYFQVARKGLKLDGTQPTLLYGYGGFEVSMTPAYSATIGSAWLEQGGVYLLANIRGGGEFGPRWHEAGLKANRQRVYDDFIAVAEDAIARKLTSPRHLGIQGGSNGGLLMGVMLTQRPDLFGAVVCQVPLLDMQRYNKLLAGASWMGEYGNPDMPEEWAYIRKYSPYQNVVAEKKYPRVLFTTSTRDDRVHPGHARKMAAKMDAQGHALLYYENIEGGHGGAANNAQRAYMTAMAYTFLWKELR